MGYYSTGYFSDFGIFNKNWLVPGSNQCSYYDYKKLSIFFVAFQPKERRQRALHILKLH